MWISEKIPKEAIEHWQGNIKILLNADCGTGKTSFVLNELYEYAREHGWKILYLSNRNLLKKQIELEIVDKQDVFTLFNYQKKEYDYRDIPWADIRQDELAKAINEQYDMVVCDEAHYFFTDSWAGTAPNVMLQTICHLLVIPAIFMTATPPILQRYVPFQDENIFVVKKPPQIEKAYYYSNDEAIERKIDSIPMDEKVIYFGRKTNRLLELKEKYNERCMFVCAESNDNFRKNVDAEKRDYLIENNKFEPQILLTTSALDNGINIEDLQVKHIICDYPDWITVKQCIGRKRFLHADDKINLYIKIDPQMYHGLLTEYKKKLKTMLDYQESDIADFATAYNEIFFKEGFVFTDKYKDIGEKPFLILDSVYYKIRYDIEFFEDIVGHGRTAFVERLCDELGISFKIFRCLEDEFNSIDTAEKLESLIDKILWKEEQKELSQFFKNGLYRLKKDSRCNKLKGINNYLKKIKLDESYEIVSKQGKNPETKKRQTYWTIRRKN
ncbi:DEAD/DEAH box helicase [Christensenella massiliensis]|uniref:Helicase ATP-binding domain-containing protein n=1 Tax=Christensenella massiliensis TaxID=1805714 RepID=A0AAU8A7U8_9FIRM